MLEIATAETAVEPRLAEVLINGTNDRYWALDALNLYSEGLRGPKRAVYVPNAGHGLETNAEYARHGIAALCRHVLGGRPLPRLDWEHAGEPGAALRLSVAADRAPLEARLWVARSGSLDFRASRWESRPLGRAGDVWVGEVARPGSGHVALFGELSYAVDGVVYHLSTQVRQTGSETLEARSRGASGPLAWWLG